MQSADLTRREAEALDAIRARLDRGQIPSHEELREDLGVRSASFVTHLLQRLEDKGRIIRGRSDEGRVLPRRIRLARDLVVSTD